MEKLPGAISSREFFYALIRQQIVFFIKYLSLPRLVSLREICSFYFGMRFSHKALDCTQRAVLR